MGSKKIRYTRLANVMTVKKLPLLLCLTAFFSQKLYAIPEGGGPGDGIIHEKLVNEFLQAIPQYSLPKYDAVAAKAVDGSNHFNRGVPRNLFPEDFLWNRISDSIKIYGEILLDAGLNPNDSSQYYDGITDIYTYVSTTNGTDVDVIVFEDRGSLWCGSGGCTSTILNKVDDDWIEVVDVFNCDVSQIDWAEKPKNIKAKIQKACSDKKSNNTLLKLIVSFALGAAATFALVKIRRKMLSSQATSK